MKRTFLALVAAACTVQGGKDVPVIQGQGAVKVDPQTQLISLDTAQIPVLPACAPGQVVRRNTAGDGWECVGQLPLSSLSGVSPVVHAHNAADVTNFDSAAVAALQASLDSVQQQLDQMQIAGQTALAALQADLADARTELTPPGTVTAFAGASIPDGWRNCDGSTVGRAEYAALFAAIGTTHGSGNGSTTFHLPDYRGRFLRGVSGPTSNDPDRTSRTAAASGGNTGNLVGSVQGDMFGSHNHTNGTNTQLLRSDCNYTTTAIDSTCGEANLLQPAAMLAAGGNETRPKNAYVNYIIKY